MPIRDTQALIEHIGRGNKVKYLFFWSHEKKQSQVSKSCLSQWYDAPFELEGIRYLTAEHYMMVEKARLFDDEETTGKILSAPHPGAAKQAGREVKNFDEKIWEQHRFDIVAHGNQLKFQQHPELKAFLLGTGQRILVEASPTDKIWGVGLPEDDPQTHNPISWRGLNLLGFALMEVRERLRGLA